MTDTPTRDALDMSLGATGLIQYSGRIYEEYLPELRGLKWRRVILEMTQQDPIIGAGLLAIEMLSRQVTWSVEAHSPEPDDQEIAAFVDSCLHDMADPWTVILSEILSFIPWGWCGMELIYKHRNGASFDPKTPGSKFDDGKIGWAGWEPRAQETLLEWQFAPDSGRATGFIQLPPPDYQYRTVPFEIDGYRKCLHFRTTSRKGNPEGRSILRTAYRPWFFGKNIENIEGIGIERDLAGLPIAYLPAEFLGADATPAQKAMVAAVKKIVQNIRRDEQEGVVFPMEYDENGKERYKISLLSTGGSRQFNTNDIIARYDARKAMTMLADFILLGHEKVGSFALSSSKTQLFSVALGAFLDTICETINTQALPTLLRLNGMDISRAPRVVHGDIESQDLGVLGEFLKSVEAAGIDLFSDEHYRPIAIRYLLRQAGLPDPGQEEPGEADDAPADVRAEIAALREAVAKLTTQEPSNAADGQQGADDE